MEGFSINGLMLLIEFSLEPRHAKLELFADFMKLVLFILHVLSEYHKGSTPAFTAHFFDSELLYPENVKGINSKFFALENPDFILKYDPYIKYFKFDLK